MRIGRRIEALENLMQPPEGDTAETERRREEIKATMEGIVAEGPATDPGRRRALEELEERFRGRVRGRRS